MDHVKSLEHKIRKESEQLEINKVKHESDLRNMSQQYETQINKLITGGSRLSRIFWEHENLSGLSIIRLIQLL